MGTALGRCVVFLFGTGGELTGVGSFPTVTSSAAVKKVVLVVVSSSEGSVLSFVLLVVVVVSVCGW